MAPSIFVVWPGELEKSKPEAEDGTSYMSGWDLPPSGSESEELEEASSEQDSDDEDQLTQAAPSHSGQTSEEAKLAGQHGLQVTTETRDAPSNSGQTSDELKPAGQREVTSESRRKLDVGSLAEQSAAGSAVGEKQRQVPAEPSTERSSHPHSNVEQALCDAGMGRQHGSHEHVCGETACENGNAVAAGPSKPENKGEAASSRAAFPQGSTSSKISGMVDPAAGSTRASTVSRSDDLDDASAEHKADQQSEDQHSRQHRQEADVRPDKVSEGEELMDVFRVHLGM